MSIAICSDEWYVLPLLSPVLLSLTLIQRLTTIEIRLMQMRHPRLVLSGNLIKSFIAI